MVDNDLMVVPRAAARTRCWRTCSSTTCSTPRSPQQNFSADRLPAAAELDHPGLARRRGVHPREPAHRDRQAGVLRRRLPAARARRRPTTPRGTTSGRRSRPADPDVDGGPGSRRTVADGAAAPRTRAAGSGRRWPRPASSGWRCFSSSRCTSCWRSCSARSTRSSARRCRCGTRCSGTPRSSTTCSTHIVGADGVFGPALLRTARLRAASPARCAC